LCATANFPLLYSADFMRKMVLVLVALLGAAASAQAQLNPLVQMATLGVTMGMNANRGPKEQDVSKDVGVSTTTYHGQRFYRKRSSAEKLRGKPAIAQLESLLEACFTTMNADSLATVCSDSQWKAIQELQSTIVEKYPSWNTEAYHHEKNFYLAEDARRQRQARARAQQQQLAESQRLRVRQDSAATRAAGR
jgi:hypothetical protein